MKVAWTPSRGRVGRAPTFAEISVAVEDCISVSESGQTAGDDPVQKGKLDTSEGAWPSGRGMASPQQ